MSVLGFLTALLFHGYIRNDDIIEGVITTLRGDALKYTSVGSRITGIAKGSDTSLLSLIEIYMLNWKTSIFFFYNEKFQEFAVLLLLALAACISRYLASDGATRFYYISLLLAGLAPPLSWFILLKTHSVIHTHLNFVLWYFGTVQFCCYICVHYVHAELKTISQRIPLFVNKTTKKT
jgi:hypothetical protein